MDLSTHSSFFILDAFEECKGFKMKFCIIELTFMDDTMSKNFAINKNISTKKITFHVSAKHLSTVYFANHVKLSCCQVFSLISSSNKNLFSRC